MDSGVSTETISNGEQRHIPSELNAAILSLVSIKPLLRLRSVCKPWRTLIDSYEFKKKHFEAAKRNVSTLFVWSNNVVKPTIHIFHPHSQVKNHSQILLDKFLTDSPFVYNLCFKKFGVVNGLVCVGWQAIHAVWNLCTAEYKMFSAPEMFWYLDLLDKSGFREDIVVNNEICAFGFDPNSQDYKFLMAYFISPRTNSHIKKITVLYQLYSLRNDSWKGVAIDFPVVSQVVTGDGYMDDGKFYWFAKKCGDKCSPAVIVFDFITEVFDWMPLAKELADGKEAVAVANRGCLEILMTFDNGGSKEDLRGEVWGMEDDGSWSRKLTANLPCKVGRPVGLLKEGEWMFEADPETEVKELLLINPDTGSCTNLGFAGKHPWVFNYVQSLFSVNL